MSPGNGNKNSPLGNITYPMYGLASGAPYYGNFSVGIGPPTNFPPEKKEPKINTLKRMLGKIL